MLSGTLVFVLAAVFLGIAAVLARGTWWRRRFAVLSAIGAAGMPWLAPAEGPLLRGGLAVWTTWNLGHVIDLAGESHDRSFAARLWHVFGLVDTRQATWVITLCGYQSTGENHFLCCSGDSRSDDRN